jgi:hypothetical protein
VVLSPLTSLLLLEVGVVVVQHGLGVVVLVVTENSLLKRLMLERHIP